MKTFTAYVERDTETVLYAGESCFIVRVQRSEAVHNKPTIYETTNNTRALAMIRTSRWRTLDWVGAAEGG
jgi:hypothetical protein